MSQALHRRQSAHAHGETAAPLVVGGCGTLETPPSGEAGYLVPDDAKPRPTMNGNDDTDEITLSANNIEMAKSALSGIGLDPDEIGLVEVTVQRRRKEPSDGGEKPVGTADGDVPGRVNTGTHEHAILAALVRLDEGGDTPSAADDVAAVLPRFDAGQVSSTVSRLYNRKNLVERGKRSVDTDKGWVYEYSPSDAGRHEIERLGQPNGDGGG